MKNYIFTVVWLFLSLVAVAQSDSWQQKYLNAKAFYSESKYALAMEAFKPLIDDQDGNYFAPYASFYYALSAYKNDYLPLGKDMLLQVKSRYPSWSKIDEVNYWLGLIYMEQGQYNQAIYSLNEIRSKDYESDIASLKLKYFSRIEDKQEVKELFETNPNEQILGYLVAKNIADESLVNQDRRTLNAIIDQFNLDPAEFNAIEIRKSVFKDSYKVAVLLPFMTTDLEPNLKRKVNQFVLDLYQGIELAVDTLKAQGVAIELHAYDTKRSERVTNEIIGKEEMKGMDLIIGPLYPRPIELVNDFSFKSAINVISPLSSSSKVIGNNPFAFLFSPSNETIGRASARYAAKNVEKKPGIIFYSDNPNDSANAFAYKQRIEADSFQIIATKKIKKDSSKLILDMLLIENVKITDASNEEAKEDYGIKPDSIGHIYVASSNDLISSKVLSAVETRGDSIVVIGSADWLKLASIKYDTYNRLGTVLYAPNHNVLGSEEYRAFRKDYIFKHRDIPNKYAEIGYELMYIMGNSLKEHGKYFQLDWREKGQIEGHLTTGFDYSNSNDNLVVPFLMFEEEEIKIVLENDIKK